MDRSGTPRDLGAFAPARFDLPSTGGQDDGDGDGEEDEEPVFGRATMKMKSKSIVETAQPAAHWRASRDASGGKPPGYSLGSGPSPHTYLSERRGSGSSLYGGGVAPMLPGLGGGSTGTNRLLNLSKDQITRQTWGTILQTQPLSQQRFGLGAQDYRR
ncbi:hypothetical protein T492DRAFT_914488 [Pavlovales sp. CCMP2436]|nr:hypothetical protein T492DRAFT_914488 [Pavlovales sp. CCMP2436]